MQWYVYPLSIFAIAFLGYIVLEQIGRPIRSVLRLRRTALERMLLVQKLALPRPRELAITSHAIHEYNLAVRNLRGAQVTFHGLGTRLLALGESEPCVRILMNFLGFNVALSGRALIRLSQVYAAVVIDSAENHRAIAWAIQASHIALGAHRPESRDDLVNIRLEPMYLRDTAYRQGRRRFGRTPMVSRYAAQDPRQPRQSFPQRIAAIPWRSA
jgi:hypothetical protein